MAPGKTWASAEAWSMVPMTVPVAASTIWTSPAAPRRSVRSLGRSGRVASQKNPAGLRLR